MISLVLGFTNDSDSFSIPVYVQASSNSWREIPTRLRDAESYTGWDGCRHSCNFADSWLTPALVPASWSSGTEEFYYLHI